MRHFGCFACVVAMGAYLLLSAQALLPTELSGASLVSVTGAGPKDCNGVLQTGVCTDASPDDNLSCQHGFNQCTSGNPNTGHCSRNGGEIMCNVPACNSQHSEKCL